MRNEQFAAVISALLAATTAAAQHAEHSAPAEHSEHAQHASHDAPVDPISYEQRAAAFPELGDMSMADMMLENPLNKLVLLDRFESQNASDGDVLNWNLEAWIGRDLDKLRIRSEGERHGGDTERAELELLWGHGFAPWWELLAGARADFAPGDEQSWAAVGVRGLAPYRFDVEATAYVGNGSRTALRLETHYELLVTNRWFLTPLLEVDWYGQTDTERLIGAGLAGAEIGLRLRYEIRREVAPYVGLVREMSFGRTADLERAAGRDTDDTRLVAGLRVWF